MRSLRTVLVAFLLCFPACTESTPDATVDSPSATEGNELVPCNPLLANELPISLGTVVAVGQTSSGTIYVVDQVETDYRVFTSVGAALQRLRITGSGTGTQPDGSRLLGFSCEVPQTGATGRLAISLRDSSAMMAFASGDLSKSDFDTVAAAGETLVLMNPADIATFELHNLPGEVTVEYNADTSDGRRFVVTRPRDEVTYQDFRVFLGDQRSLMERALVDVMRTKSGQTNIRFDVDGTEAVAFFPAPGGDTTKAATLTKQGGVSTLVDAGVLDPEQTSFECLTGALQ